MKTHLNNAFIAIIIIVVIFGALMLGEWIAPTSGCAEYPSYVRGDC